MDTQENGTIAVFGGTGQQGGAVVDALLARGARVRALVRTPESDRARALAARGVELSAIRIGDATSTVAALEAVDAFSFMTPEANSLEDVEEEVRVGTALVDAAAAARVPHVVFTSVFGADRETGVPHHDSKHRIEEYLKLSGLRATMVRPTAFMENFATVMAPSLEDGTIVLRLPLPDDIALKMVSIKNIGQVAASILLGTAEVPGGAVEVVGDELTGSQIAAAFGARAGLPARYETLPLSVLGNDLDKAMFREFATASEHPSDLAAVRAIEPATWDLAEWIRSTGWTAPADRVRS
ncbi:NmrA/HSCARG family protein [Amycolatopsis solani]|uniref:NmrA/HSCARG family protein n=1 Tax=Amycolatopsis solani TaxID=3028615 RepID=UPI0025AFB7FB|nr:NmrA/HSCARG family protein [Amycolatopsis sp. MEP2-6]